MKPFEERKEEFLKRYEELVNEMKCDVASGPQFFPMGGGAFGIMIAKDIMDLENQPIPSPFTSDHA